MINDDDDDDGGDDDPGPIAEIDALDVERRAFDTERAGFSLLRAAALLPRVEGRTVDVDAVELAVDGYAQQIAERVERAGTVEAVFDVLFATAGFRGPEAEYDAPAHSFLDEVLARKRGLPIALSLILVEAATRAGLKAWGLALPGHFLAGIFVNADRFAVMDPWAGGILLSPDAVAARAGVPATELGEVLQPATPHAVLVRMLVNLAGSYTRRSLHQPLARTLDRLLLLRPVEPRLLLERAAVRRLLLDDDGAHQDLDEAEALADDDDALLRAAAALRAELERGRLVH
jgi:regulator of sirC expression with transglutaminase-like and TPR domain